MFGQGFNCAQAVLACSGEWFGLDRELAVRLARGLGGGIGNSGHVCGAVSGAVMVIGLATSGPNQTDPQLKQKTAARVRDFLARFKQRNKSILCRDLTGCDLSTPEGMQEARQKGVFDSVCPNAIRDAVQILGEIVPHEPSAHP